MSHPGSVPGGSRLARNSLKKKLRSRGFVVGTFLEIGSPALVELLGLAGFDFVVVDGEHGALDLRQTEELVRAGASTPISVMVRVAACETHLIAKPLDMGAAGVHVPQVDSAPMAQAVVNAAMYHPLGARGLQVYVRAASYRAFPTPEYLASANDEILTVVHIEGKAGLDSLDAILDVKGIDVIFLGPYDLSQSLGIPGQVKDQRVKDALADLARRARAKGKWVGTYWDDAESAREFRDLGVSYVTVSIDSEIFLSSARSLLEKLN